MRALTSTIPPPRTQKWKRALNAEGRHGVGLSIKIAQQQKHQALRKERPRVR